MHKHVFQLLSAVGLLFAGSESLLAEHIAERPLPSKWTISNTAEVALPTDDNWWRLFGDATLDSLLELAQNNNFNLEIAARRLDQAAQAVRSASAAYFPTVGATAGWQRAHTTGATAGSYSLGVSASWEVDVFGKTYSRVKAQRYSRDASAAQYAEAMLSMCASMATAYFDLRTAQAQLLVAEAHSQAQDSIVSKAVARFEAGLASKLDVSQARTVLYSTRATIPALRTRIEADKQAIALLCGVYAPEIESSLQYNAGMQPDYRRIVSLGVPAELLRRRPDVVAAEADVESAAASLGVARKDYLPSLEITGSIGTAAGRPDGLFKDGSMTWSVAPTLSWTIFDGLARKAAVVSARDEMEAQIANYNATLQNAYGEVEKALAAYTNSLRSIELFGKVVDEAHESLLLSVDLYTQGLTPFNNVVDAQMNYLTYTNSLVDARGDALAALVNLYRALGGGYELK